MGLAADGSGTGSRAAQLALSAYLEGIEPVEPQLSVRAAALLIRIETEMTEYRAGIRGKAPLSHVAEQARMLEALLDDAAPCLIRRRWAQ